MRHIGLAALVVLALSSCTTGLGLGIDIQGTNQDISLGSAADLSAEIAALPDIGFPTQDDALIFEVEAWSFDTAPDQSLTGCEPGEGCFLDPCNGNEDCLSGWCVGHMGASVCTMTCQSECPSGWSCQQVAGTDPDVVFICVSDFATLCRPCEQQGDCTGLAGEEDVCVDYGPEGSFCGGQCQDDADCPWGFGCNTVSSVDGVSLKQCVADAGTCPCTERSIELALWTPCQAENERGLCEGKRICLEDGLSDCDAALPSLEECNGIDDDCDGDVDELTCDDDNQCTDDACLGEAGCQFLPLEQGECMDGDPCTVADHCEQGVCVGQQVNCDDQNPCTDDACDIAGGCIQEFNQEKCDDGNPCTVADQCAEGVCAGVAVNCECQADENCLALEDGDVCNGVLYCNKETLPYSCEIDLSTVVECPSPDGVSAPCLVEVCDAQSGACSFAPANDGGACDDGDPCTVMDTCQAGECVAGVPVNCNDGNPCTDDTCVEGEGCEYTFNSAPCEDGDSCTLNDQCSMGQCAGGPEASCDDANPCTDDSCVPGQGCSFVFNEAQCDDANVCTTGDHCELGKCVASGMADCDDDNICTTDLCTPGLGCTHQFNAAPCDDLSACTAGDICGLGACSGTPVSCDDGNVCTDDSCDPLVGCENAPNQGPCDDNNLCTQGDKCNGGLCLPGSGVFCFDDNPCTDDLCEPAVGCAYNSNQADCSDGDPCTVGDKCELGLCTSE